MTKQEIIEIVELILELILFVVFVVLVHLDVQTRFVFGVGVIYLAMVIRHSKEGGKE